MTNPVHVVVASAIALLFCAAPAAAQDASRDKEYAEEIQKGETALQRRQFRPALDAFKKASSLRNKTSAEAYVGMAKAYQGLREHKDAADACADALKHGGGDARVEATARNIRGVSLIALAGSKADDKRLKEAEADFRAVLALPEPPLMALFNLGVVLLKQQRDAEGLAPLKVFVERGGRMREVETARRMIDNPRRAREPYAPDFEIVTATRERLTLEKLRGKTVVLDFWGTWCGPCREATPALVELNRKYANQPFVMIGIAVNDPEDRWRLYIEEHKMDWPQYRDNRLMQTLFQVNAFPTYIVIDGEGIVRAREIALGAVIDGTLEREIKKSLKAAAPAPPR
jgi:thiol-disulfide isomerase/thioredoxin